MVLTFLIAILVSMDAETWKPSSDGKGYDMGSWIWTRAPYPVEIPVKYSVVSRYKTSFSPRKQTRHLFIHSFMLLKCYILDHKFYSERLLSAFVIECKGMYM